MQHSVNIDIEQLLRIAKRRGLTQAQLCEKAGLNRCIIARLKSNGGRARIATITKLIKAAND